MASYLTPNRHGYSVRFSPFNPDRLIVATSQYFGLTGGGTLFTLDLQNNHLHPIQSNEWSDGLFDACWSETNPSLVVTASGDGALQLWNLSAPHNSPPVSIYAEHKKEVYSVDWDKFLLSASWDCSIKLWDPNHPQASLNTFFGHSQLVYSAMFSPHVHNCFASVSGDGTLKLWTNSTPEYAATFRVHEGEVLSCDWGKKDENLIATGGSEGLVRGWDVRKFQQPVFQLKGCESAIRRVRFSPHTRGLLAGVGFDFATRIWDANKGCEPIETIRHHSEFVYGVDWSGHQQGLLADCGWDSKVHVFTPECLKSV